MDSGRQLPHLCSCIHLVRASHTTEHIVPRMTMIPTILSPSLAMFTLGVCCRALDSYLHLKIACYLLASVSLHSFLPFSTACLLIPHETETRGDGAWGNYQSNDPSLSVTVSQAIRKFMSGCRPVGPASRIIHPPALALHYGINPNPYHCLLN